MRGRIITAQGEPRAGVRVSDGATVTASTSDGSFTLTPSGPFVFVVRPAGYGCEHWFVPAAVEDVIFVLTPEPDVFPHRFVHISDLHVSRPDLAAAIYPQPNEMGSHEALAAFFAGLTERAGEVASVVATGDLTDFGSDEEFEALRKAVEGSPVPVHLLPGNHDHIGGSFDAFSMEVTRTNYLMHSGDPAGYERNIGPRWYSFDLPGLHVVALDWHTHELGLDNDRQDAWLRADLESLSAGTPWILLSHDQPWTSILAGLPSQPLATFSGHRHTSRVVEVGGTLHVNTPTPLFGALDYSPPSYRVVTWDGERIALRTQAVAPTGLERATFEIPDVPWARMPAGDLLGGPYGEGVRWVHQLSGPGHRAPVRVSGDLVLAGVRHEDSASGAVEALNLADGTLAWRAPMRSSVKGTPTVHGTDPDSSGSVLVAEVSGDVVSLDLADGRERWRVPSPDPLRQFIWLDPVVADGLAIVGDLCHLRALDADTGELCWERTDLTPYQTIVAHSAPTVVGDTLIVGAWPAPATMIGLDLHTGATRWPTDPPAGGMALDSPTPIGSPLHDPATGDLVFAASGRVVRMSSADGSTIWSAPVSLPLNPATPAATPDGIAIADAGFGLVLLSREDGSPLWRTPLGGPSPFAMTSYTRTTHAIFAGPTLLTAPDGTAVLIAPGLDGVLHVVDAATGAVRRPVDVGVPVAAPVTAAGDLLFVVGVDGRVLAFDRAVLR